LEQRIGADNAQVQGYQGRLADLQTRLSAIESSLAIQRSVLIHIEIDYTAAHNRLNILRSELTQDRQRLAAQLVAQYESPPPDLVSVVLESRGFSDLLERMHNLGLIARQNAKVVTAVSLAKKQVRLQTLRLAAAQVHQRQVVAAVAVEQDEIANLRLAVLQRERVAERDRARQQAALHQVQRQLAILQARAAAAQRASFAASDISSGSLGGNDGPWGFFPAPGTNYTFGEEPEIAARLERLGVALHLHLIGISGYRTPQHSVEVGGFADDPHTRGEASDTPGVEGVPEATLLQFGLTRPFPGAAEADHIQLS